MTATRVLARRFIHCQKQTKLRKRIVIHFYDYVGNSSEGCIRSVYLYAGLHLLHLTSRPRARACEGIHTVSRQLSCKATPEPRSTRA